MKKSLISIAATMVLASVVGVNGYADSSDCSAGSIHCAYISGLNEKDTKDGRYIKATYTIKGQQQSIVQCYNNTGTVEVTADEAPDFVGNDSVAFAICKDQAGSSCQMLGTDNFVVSPSGSNYTAIPGKYNVDLSGVAAQFPQCDGSQNSRRKLD